MSVYACSDLHGYKSIYDKICKDLQPNDHVYFLGDAGDRGPQSWELIKAIYQNPQFTYILGNHEDMLVKAMRDWLEEGLIEENYWLLCDNRGVKTFNGWTKETTEDQHKWYKALSRLPVMEEFVNKYGYKIILTHAGFTPKIGFNPPDRHKLIWDRGHIGDLWNPCIEDTIIIHGHTPFRDGVYRYADGHKIDIDCGTYSTKYAALIDLNTLESRIYEV